MKNKDKKEILKFLKEDKNQMKCQQAMDDAWNRCFAQTRSYEQADAASDLARKNYERNQTDER